MGQGWGSSSLREPLRRVVMYLIHKALVDLIVNVHGRWHRVDSKDVIEWLYLINLFSFFRSNCRIRKGLGRDRAKQDINHTCFVVVSIFTEVNDVFSLL